VILIHCDGRTLEAMRVGPVKVRFVAGEVPLKWNGWRLLEDDKATELLREVAATGLYRCEDGK
jgi:hypothetical protein